MRFHVLALAVGLVAAGSPLPASALQVDISYTITGGSNSTGWLFGAAPTGGSAIVRWSLTSLNGAFINGAPGSLVSFSVTAPSMFGVHVPSVYGTQIPISAGAGGIISVPFGFAPNFFYGLISHQAGGGFAFSARAAFSPAVNGAHGGTIRATGNEVFRTVVPEPNTAVLLALGLGGLAAGRTVWRTRLRRNA